MRIIAGKHRGRRLAAPQSDLIRPTTDRVRESLFAILADMEDQVILDGFAGSGALGCEALSRGAAHVFFVDTSREALDLVRRNVETLHELDRATVIPRPFDKALSGIDREVDLVFLDPPYGTKLAAQALEALSACEFVSSGALIVLEQDVRDAVPEQAEFEHDDERVYGTTRLTFLYRR